jgi:phosphoribosylformimino-5-aminoimidazole carboxamide ribotide isomerase
VLKRYHADPSDATFALLPAIDLRGGRVVRLVQGDFERETRYGDDALSVATNFVDAGARWLHLVDLDGAREGAPRQSDIIGQIVAAVGERASCEVAGGLRSPGAVDAVLAGGATRAVVGTAALRDSSFARRLVDRHGASRIAIAIDVRDGLALGEGWRSGAAGVAPEVAISLLADEGLTTFEVTAVNRDGLLGGPDLDLLERLVALDRGKIIASGGIARVEDVLAVRDLGCGGAIVGRALYEGRFSVADAVAAISGSIIAK